MSSRSVVVLAILVVAGIAYLVLDARDRPGGGPEPGLALLDLEPARVRTLEIAGAARADTIRLERRADAWWMTEPQNGPADSGPIEALVNRLAAVRRVPDPERESRAGGNFGFDDPAAVVTLGTGDVEHVFAIGDATPIPGRRYARVDGGPVATVDESLFERLASPAVDLRDRQILALDPFDADRWILEDGSARVVVVRRGDLLTVGDPEIDLADEAVVRELLFRFGGLEVIEFRSTENAPPFETERSFRVVRDDGPDEAFRLGPPVPGRPALRFAEADRFPGEMLTVPADLIRDLSADRARFRAKRLVDLGGVQVTRLRFGAAPEGDAVELEKRRDGWHLTAPVTMPAESDVVDALADAIGSIEIRRYLADRVEDPAAHGLPGRAIEIDTTHGPRSFLAGSVDRASGFLRVARDVNGPLLAVDADVLDLLPTTIRDVRTRDIASIDLFDPATMILGRSDRTVRVESDNLDFRVVEPIEGVLDGRVAQALEERLGPLRATRIAELAADAETLGEYGLSDPRLVLEVTSRPSTRPAFTHRLAFGREDEDGDVFATIDDTGLVFAVDPALVAVLESEWLERDPFDLETAAVRRIRITDSTRELHLLRGAGGFDVVAPEGARLDPELAPRLAEALGDFEVVRYEVPPPPADRRVSEPPLLIVQFEADRDASASEHLIEIRAPVSEDDGASGFRASSPDAPAPMILDRDLVALLREALDAANDRGR